MFSTAQRQLSLVSPVAAGPFLSRGHAAVRARGVVLDPLFGHLRLAHPPDGAPAAERALGIVRELAWSVPHVERVGSGEVRFRLERAKDAPAAVAVARAIALRAGATEVRVAVGTSPVVAALASRRGDLGLLDHDASLSLLADTPTSSLPVGAGARILLAAARVASLLDLAGATALPALDEIERIRVPAARAAGLVRFPAAPGLASIALEEAEQRTSRWVWLATPLLRRAASRLRRRRADGSVVVGLRARLARGGTLGWAIEGRGASVRALTDSLALGAGEVLRAAELAAPIVRLEVHGV